MNIWAEKFSDAVAKGEITVPREHEYVDRARRQAQIDSTAFDAIYRALTHGPRPYRVLVHATEQERADQMVADIKEQARYLLRTIGYDLPVEMLVWIEANPLT